MDRGGPDREDKAEKGERQARREQGAIRTCRVPLAVKVIRGQRATLAAVPLICARELT